MSDKSMAEIYKEVARKKRQSQRIQFQIGDRLIRHYKHHESNESFTIESIVVGYRFNHLRKRRLGYWYITVKSWSSNCDESDIWRELETLAELLGQRENAKPYSMLHWHNHLIQNDDFTAININPDFEIVRFADREV